MRALVVAVALLSSMAPACYDDTAYCQSGPKTGTQCYNSDGERTSSSTPSDPPPPSNNGTGNSTTPNTNR